MPASTWRGTEYRLHDRYATIGAHIEIYWSHEKHCEVQCLKYNFSSTFLWRHTTFYFSVI
jgi:hypothetical protein